jgi:ribokinase
LPWDDLTATDAVYFTAGDDDSLRLARRASTLVATTREAQRLARVGVYLDAVVGSGRDPAERYIELDPPPRLVVETLGADGGRYMEGDASRTFESPKPPGPVVCSYGAGDSFAAGLTYALGRGLGGEEALALAARCGAAVLTGHGPYDAQLGATDF